MTAVSYTHQPPGMSERTYQFLRGVSAAIDQCLYYRDADMATCIEAAHPMVRSLRNDGVFSAIRAERTHTLHRGGSEENYGLVVTYLVQHRVGPSPSESVWMVPAR